VISPRAAHRMASIASSQVSAADLELVWIPAAAILEPWNSKLIWRSKFDSRLTVLAVAHRVPRSFRQERSESLGIRGERRKRHSRTAEPYGKSGPKESLGL
jgi:hypothetical protein